MEEMWPEPLPLSGAEPGWVGGRGAEWGLCGGGYLRPLGCSGARSPRERARLHRAIHLCQNLYE